MKNKRAEQIAQKKAHKVALKNAKHRRATPDFQIPAPERLERQRFLIVCEGLNTEKDYFNHLRCYCRLSATEVIAVGGAGDPIRVVQRAKSECEKSHFDQTWVVFDKDDFPADNFDNAIHMAENAGFGVAYSNQAFEYWLILHFEDHQGGGMHRDLYNEKLNEYLNPYNVFYDGKGRKKISSSFFNMLMESDEVGREKRIDLAMRRAEKVHALHKNAASPASAESSTTVYKLVQELLKFV